MEHNTGKVLNFYPRNRRYMRAYMRNFNYFAPLFWVSLSFNVMFLMLNLLK